MERWHVPFRMEGDPFGTSIPVPDRVARVTEVARQAFLEGEVPDQVVPGFYGLGPALVVRNLTLAFLGSPPLIVYSTDASLTAAYHGLKDPIMGRFAVQFPMFYLGPERKPRPVSSRGLSRSNPPAPCLYRANSIDEILHWFRLRPEAYLLVVVGNPSEVPANRPPASHVILQGVLGIEADHSNRLRRPCALALPNVADKPTVQRDTHRSYASFAWREWNASHASLLLEEVRSSDDDLGRLAQMYRVLAKQSWERWGGFLGIMKLVYHRLEADALPSTVPAPKEAGISTESLLQILSHALQLHDAPPVPEARSFAALGARIVQRRATHVSGKGTWVETHPVVFRGDETPTLLVDSSFSEARWSDLSRAGSGTSPRYRVVPLGAPRQAPLTGGAVVCAAPSARLLHDLVAGGTSDSLILLYPWELDTYAAARRFFLARAKLLGVEEWPSLPELPEASPWQPAEGAEFVPHTRTFDWSAQDEEDIGDAVVPSLPGTDLEGPAIRITSSRNTYQLPADRQVVVIRGKAYYELEASNANVGDILVMARGTSDPSASKVIERLCRRNPVMNRTRAMSDMWRDGLKEFVAANFPGKSVADAFRGMSTAVTVTYTEFLHWLRDGEPITPTRSNLLRLMAHLGYGEDLAIMIYEEGLHHKRDRRELLDYVLDLANSRLDDIYDKALTAGAIDESLSLTVEDLTAVVGFETITALEEVHARG